MYNIFDAIFPESDTILPHIVLTCIDTMYRNIPWSCRDTQKYSCWALLIYRYQSLIRTALIVGKPINQNCRYAAKYQLICVIYATASLGYYICISKSHHYNSRDINGFGVWIMNSTRQFLLDSWGLNKALSYGFLVTDRHSKR